MIISLVPARIFAKTLVRSSVALVCLAGAATAAEINIYSYREPQLVQPLLAAFTAKTGIKANLVFAKDGLIERMVAEAGNSPVDVLLTNEFGLLTLARDKGVTQPLTSPTIAAEIPAQYRDSEGHWIGLTGRARVVYASKDRVKQEAITLEELAEPKWRGKVCIRSGQYTYNTALFASLVLHKGAAWTEQWLKDVKDTSPRNQPAATEMSPRPFMPESAMSASPTPTIWARCPRPRMSSIGPGRPRSRCCFPIRRIAART